MWLCTPTAPSGGLGLYAPGAANTCQSCCVPARQYKRLETQLDSVYYHMHLHIQHASPKDANASPRIQSKSPRSNITFILSVCFGSNVYRVAAQRGTKLVIFPPLTMPSRV